LIAIQKIAGWEKLETLVLDSVVQLIDFAHPERNVFHAINQFRIDTPGCLKASIIPDIVLFVNGIPLVVVEAKIDDPNTANPHPRGIRAASALPQRTPGERGSALRDSSILASREWDRLNYEKLTSTPLTR
jgi:hypothetical protein